MMPRAPLFLAVALLALLWTAPTHAVTCSGTIPAVNPDADYIDHLDGTVTHVPTGLMWKKCAEGLSGSDCATGTATTHDWSDALALAEGASFAGHSDWRLPNINELHSLVETCRTNPAINNDVFPNTPSSVFWSASPFAGSTGSAWVVYFSDGNASFSLRSNDVRVRLVRGGQSFASFDSRLSYTPDALEDFAAVTDATAGDVTPSTDSKTLAGLETVTGIKIEGEGSPQYRVNDGGWTAAPGAVSDGDEIEVRLTAGAAGETRSATLTVGGQTAVFSVTVPEEGVCGAADGVASLLPPATGLCSAGTPGAVSSIDGGHAWSCEGGSTAQCTAPGADAGGVGGSGSATMELLSGAGCTVESAELVTPPPGLPAGASLPFGALSFVLEGCDAGATATLQVTYDAPVGGLVYWKHIGDAWLTMPATLSGNTATFSITDGGPFDADATPGRIADPGGPGLQPLSHGEATPIPTLSQWMVAVLAMALLLIGSGMRRKR